MDSNVIDLRLDFFIRSYNNIVSYVQALKPGILQNYCSTLLIQAKALIGKKSNQSVHLAQAFKIVKGLNHLVQTFPDNPTSVKNMTLIVDAAFYHRMPMFLAQQPIHQFFDISMIQDFYYIYCRGTQHFNICHQLYKADKKIMHKDARQNISTLDMFFIHRLHYINEVGNNYLRQMHLLSNNKFNLKLYRHKINSIDIHYQSLSYPGKYFDNCQIQIMYELCSDKIARQYPGLCIIKNCLYYGIFQGAHINAFHTIIYLPTLANIAILLCLFDASLRGILNHTQYSMSKPCINLIQQLNDLNYKIVNAS